MRAETVRDELSNAVIVDHGAVAGSANDFNVAARQLRRLEDRLAAPAARRDWSSDVCSSDL